MELADRPALGLGAARAYAAAAFVVGGALRWHAYLWDPWFLGWGVLVALALLASRPSHRRPDRTGGGGPETMPPSE